MPEGRRVTVPAEISLHGLGHPESGKSTGFRGAGVRSREDLPDWLVAGPLVEFRSGDEAGFPGGFFGKDRGKEGWDAVWRGEDDGARLEVSWDPGFGWSIATTFLGDMVQNAFGYRSLPFGRAFQMGTAGMTGRISRALGKIGVPAFTGDGPDLSFLPDGMFLHVAVPVAGNRLRETEAWAERPRSLILEASDFRRTPCPLSSLTLAVKCGTSDATSGIAGNPTVGAMFDTVVKAGGTAFFSETTEIIGAENLVADRAATPEVGERILAAAKRWEEKALSTGEDIRKINPIPANIAAGISTLEEKSLGAIAKSGHMPIQGVLDYAERPAGPGLYFIDSWMSSLSLPLCFTASGAAIVLYQMGGGALPKDPMMPAINPTVVSPFMYVTGNRVAYSRSPDNFDFNSSAIMDGTSSIEEEGAKLLRHVLDVMEGSYTKMETLDYAEQLEVFMEGPVL